MKKIQCAKCGQIFWKELEVDETLVASGEWIQTPCPKCEAEWAIVEPGRRMPGEARRRTVKPPTRRQQVGSPPEEKAPIFTPARIFSLRKKLGLSQKELGSLAGVDRGSILGWEKGKFKPREEKAAQLAALAMKGKEKVRKLLGEKIAKQEAKSNPNRSKRRRGASQRVAKAPKK